MLRLLPLLCLLLPSTTLGAEDAEDPDEAEPDEAEPFDPYQLDDGITAPPKDARAWAVRPGPEPEDFALAVPRALLSPLWLVTTALAYPIDGVLVGLEEGYVIPHIQRALWFDKGRTVGWSPAVGFSFSDGLSLGATVGHYDLFGYGESLTLSSRFGGRNRVMHELSFGAARLGGSHVRLEALVRYERDPAERFEGIGGSLVQDCSSGSDPEKVSCKTFYSVHRLLAVGRLGGTFGRPGKLVSPGVSVIYNHRKTDGTWRPKRLSTDAVYDTSTLVGFGEARDVLEVTGDLLVETRTQHGLDPVGFSMELFGGGAPPMDGSRFWHYGVEMTGGINLFGGNRLLLLRGLLEAVHGPDDGIPFTHLVTLGGPDRLRGYRTSALRGRRAAMVGIEYRWPAHRNVRAFLHTEVGRVAADYAGMVDGWEGLKPSAGGGLLFGTPDSMWFRVDLAYGDSVQLSLSTDVASAFRGRTTR